jgi:hypothetical protein
MTYATASSGVLGGGADVKSLAAKRVPVLRGELSWAGHLHGYGSPFIRTVQALIDVEALTI